MGAEPEDTMPPQRAPQREGTPSLITIQRQMAPFRGGQRWQEREETEKIPKTDQTPSEMQWSPSPLSRIARIDHTDVEENTQLKPDATVVHKIPPFRLIRAELVNTIESSNLETPVIGLVTEDVWWDGELVIVAGTEIHGTVRSERLRNRVISGENWALVPPANKLRKFPLQKSIRGVALDRNNPSGDGLRFGISDGSFGLKGEVIEFNKPDEIRLFTAAFLEGMARTAQSREPTGSLLGGTQPQANPTNALYEGSAEVLREYAAIIRKEIERHGRFVRVPAGKQFYLYTLPAIEPEGTVPSTSAMAIPTTQTQAVSPVMDRRQMENELLDRRSLLKAFPGISN